MNDARRPTLDFETIVNAFDVMGRYLRDECSLDRDFEDAVNLALAIGIGTIDHLKQLFTSFFPAETLHPSATARLPELAENIQLRRTG